MNYERDMYIDHTALDVEWLEQAQLAAKWGNYYNECLDEFTRAEENVKTVRSELTIEINKNPEKFLGDDVKPTDTKVDAAIRIHKSFLAAKERWMKAMKKMKDAEVVKNEIGFTRKSALENLVTLHGQMYFAGPKMPRDLSNEWKKKHAESVELNKNVKKVKRFRKK